MKRFRLGAMYIIEIFSSIFPEKFSEMFVMYLCVCACIRECGVQYVCMQVQVKGGH